MNQNLRKRLAMWAIGVALLLLIPLALTIRDGAVEGVGWNWTFFDFIFMGTLLFGAGAMYELVARKMNNGWYRAGLGLATLTSVLLVWINAAVGIIGDDDGFNVLYFGVLLIGLTSALIAGFTSQGMSRALFFMALAQLSVPVIALIISDPVTWGTPGILGVFVLNAVFAALFIGSALLFREANTRDNLISR